MDGETSKVYALMDLAVCRGGTSRKLITISLSPMERCTVLYDNPKVGHISTCTMGPGNRTDALEGKGGEENISG